MTAPVRDRPEFHQARKSIYQLSERLNDFGWLLTVPDEDLGEDLIVHIYYQGKATGVLFHVQVKSVTNLNQRRKKDHVPYPIEVTDLLHWESFELPVVLIVWDVAQREGRWLFLSQAIEKLNQTQPEWRQQQKKTLHIPWTNKTDDANLTLLKQQIGHYLYPLLAKDKQLDIEMKLNFPLTDPVGQEAFAAFERFIKEGTPVTVTEAFVDKFTFPKWYSNWFGKFDPNSVEITLGPATSDRKINVAIQILCDDGSSSPIYSITLKIDNMGITGTYLKASNHYQIDAPFYLELVGSQRDASQQLTITLESKELSGDPCSILQVTQFWDHYARGGELRLEFFTPNGKKFHQNRFLPQPRFRRKPDYIHLIEKLCFIQNKLGRLFHVPIEGISPNNRQGILKLFDLLKRGKVIRNDQRRQFLMMPDADGHWFLEALKSARENTTPINFRESFESSWVELFGQKIATGPIVQYFDGKVLQNPNEVPGMNHGEMELVLEDCKVTEIFPQFFMREAERLSNLLAQKYSFKRLYLFGSLVWDDKATPQTDIDMAIEGLNPADFFEAMAYLEGLTEFPFDLIALESAPSALRERIINEGKLLYEQKAGSTGLTANGSTHRI